MQKQGQILKIKQGYNPNSSSMGSIILTMPFVVIPALSILAVTAGIIMNSMMPEDKQSSNLDKSRENNVDN